MRGSTVFVSMLLIFGAGCLEEQGSPDRDDDGVHDGVDNCIDDANPFQQDEDEDSRGDACDSIDDRVDLPGATQTPSASIPTTSQAPTAPPRTAPPPQAVPSTSASQCLAYQARDWRTNLLEQDFSTFTATIKGEDGGASYDALFSVDENQDYAYLEDTQEETITQSHGEDIFVTLDGETYHFRQVGAISFADWSMQDDGSEETAWFSEPSARFTPSCTSYGGAAAYRLLFTSGGIQEEWMFSSTGNLLSATYKDTATATDLAMTFQPTAFVRAPPGGTKASFIEYSIISEGQTQDGWHQTLRVEEGTFYEYYDQIDIDLYNDDALVAELTPDNGYSSPHGYVTFVDEGQNGIMDQGDLIQVWSSNAANMYYLYNRWSGTYFEESLLEAPDPEEATSLDSGEVISKRFEWTYAGEDYWWDMDIPVGLLEYYASLPSRDTVEGRYGSVQAQYVTSSLDDEFIQGLADGMLEFGQGEGFTDDEILSLTLAFVQSLQYTQDEVTSPFDEWPRYPMETLAEEGGDCEDTSILFAALSLAMGYDTVLLNPPGHMAVGVAAEADVPGGGYTYQGTRYLFAETTGEGFGFGDVPDPYQGQSAHVYPLDPGPAVVIEDVSFTSEDGYHHVVVTFSNDGNGATAAGRATVFGFDGAAEYYYDSDHCTFDSLDTATQYTCDLYLRVLPEIERIEAVVKTQDGLYAKTY